MSRRTVELLLLLAAAPVVLLIFALLTGAKGGTVAWADLAVPASLIAAFLAAHVGVRVLAPNADPGLLPIAALLTGVGLAFVTRLDAELAASQVVWIFVGVAAMVGTLAAVRSLERLADYKYTTMIAGLLLLLLPVFVGTTINGARLWIRFAGLSFQPGELAKVLIVVFLAAYLSENRELLSVSTRRVAGVWLPPLKHLGPLILMWALSLVVLVFERDLGSSLLLFGIFLVMIYVATGRPTYVVAGLVMFTGGAYVAYRLFDHVRVRVDIWLHPFADATGKGYQLVQSLFAFGAGGVTGVGPGRGMPGLIPFAVTDFIYSAIGEELGLLGASAIAIAFLVFALRGLSTGARARSDMAAFTATGIVAWVLLQAFVIAAGVSRLIPVTGVTLPFISYGGSSILATFIALGLLLRAGDAATGTESDLQTSTTDLGVLGRLALVRRLRRTGIFFSVLMVALIVNLTFVQVVQAPAYAANPANVRGIAEEARQDRGSILMRDGSVLAQSVPAESGQGRYFKRVYPKGKFASNVVGYLSPRYGRAGIEAAANDVLTGKRVFASFADVIAQASGEPVVGNDVVLTLDPSVQRAAENSIRGFKGACVVFDPRSGAVLAMAANPGYDPNRIDQDWAKLQKDPSSPLVDRSRLSLYAPGSTFKIVTTTAGLSSGVLTAKTAFPGPGRLVIGNAPVTNFEGGSFGRITLETALANSVNTYFAQAAVKIGAVTLVRQAEAFGFNSRPPCELLITPSLMPDPAEMTEWETAWAGVGQPVGEHESPSGPQATVSQMALCAAGIANDGTVMQPYLVDRVTDPAGRELAKTAPKEWRQATDPGTANEVTRLMELVVRQGSGYRAQISGVSVAGKTGTAEVGKGLPTNAWFVAFAPAERPTVAMAIVLEGGGIGGRAAAPRAKPVLQAGLAAQKGR
jgi:cell division protein FtsW (lipid II flippase)/cell division protein FtsI/penicillin-binding protein 2